MIERPTSSFSRVRRSLLAAAASMVVPRVAWPDEAVVDASPELYKQIFALMSSANQMLTRHRTQDGIALVANAHSLVEADPATRWPWRIWVNSVYGSMLLDVGRKQEALAILQAAFNAEMRVRARQIEPFYSRMGMVTQWDEVFGRELFEAEFKLQLAAVAIINGPQPHTLAEQVVVTSPGTAEPRFTLARAMLACGEVDALAKFYRDQIASAPLPSEEDMPARLSFEHRFFKFGVLLAQAGRAALADDAFRRALQLNDQRLKEILSYVSSYTAVLAAFGVRRSMLAIWLGSRLGVSGSDRLGVAATAESVGLIVQTKGLGVRYAERADRLLYESTAPGVSAARSELELIDDRMAALPPGSAGFEQFLALSIKATQSFARILPDLRARGLSDMFMPGATMLSSVQRALRGDAALGFVEYSTVPSEDGSVTKRYARYCLAGATVQLRDVGTRDEIDREVFGLRRALLAGGDGRTHGTRLTQALLTGLPAEAGRAQRWVIDPDGALALLPFEALPDARGEPLLMRRTVRYTTSLAQLVDDDSERPAHGPACLVADPAYPPPPADEPGQADSGAPVWRLSNGALFNGVLTVAVSELPDTREEADSVSASLTKMGLTVNVYEGGQATPDALNALDTAPSILHVASHAALFEPQTQSGTPADGSISSSDTIVDLLLPGRRAGLVLAGRERPSVMLAKDIARLPLQGTQLAVLSGCDTGNGDVDVGEGVSGLRRALEQAGAATTVTSLWPVQSDATVTLMSEFYAALAKGSPKSEALRQAKTMLRKQGHPTSAWAGFLLAGSDAPLQVRTH